MLTRELKLASTSEKINFSTYVVIYSLFGTTRAMQISLSQRSKQSDVKWLPLYSIFSQRW